MRTGVTEKGRHRLFARRPATTIWHTVSMCDEHSLTSRQADQLQTDIANVESGLEVIMEQVAQLPTRKESATQGDGLGDRDPGEDEGCV